MTYLGVVAIERASIAAVVTRYKQILNALLENKDRCKVFDVDDLSNAITGLEGAPTDDELITLIDSILLSEKSYAVGQADSKWLSTRFSNLADTYPEFFTGEMIRYAAFPEFKVSCASGVSGSLSVTFSANAGTADIDKEWHGLLSISTAKIIPAPTDDCWDLTMKALFRYMYYVMTSAYYSEESRESIVRVIRTVNKQQDVSVPGYVILNGLLDSLTVGIDRCIDWSTFVILVSPYMEAYLRDAKDYSKGFSVRPYPPTAEQAEVAEGKDMTEAVDEADPDSTPNHCYMGASPQKSAAVAEQAKVPEEVAPLLEEHQVAIVSHNIRMYLIRRWAVTEDRPGRIRIGRAVTELDTVDLFSFKELFAVIEPLCDRGILSDIAVNAMLHPWAFLNRDRRGYFINRRPVVEIAEEIRTQLTARELLLQHCRSAAQSPNMYLPADTEEISLRQFTVRAVNDITIAGDLVKLISSLSEVDGWDSHRRLVQELLSPFVTISNDGKTVCPVPRHAHVLGMSIEFYDSAGMCE